MKIKGKSEENTGKRVLGEEDAKRFHGAHKILRGAGIWRDGYHALLSSAELQDLADAVVRAQSKGVGK